MEHPILFISLILQSLGLPVPHGLVGGTVLEKLVSPHMTYTWLVMLILILVPKLTLGKMSLVPGKGQNFWEVVIGGLEGFMTDNMGKEGAKMMFPMLATFALYILVANMIGLLPGFMSPTSNLNITLACTLIVFFTTHILGCLCIFFGHRRVYSSLTEHALSRPYPFRGYGIESYLL